MASLSIRRVGLLAIAATALVLSACTSGSSPITTTTTPTNVEATAASDQATTTAAPPTTSTTTTTKTPPTSSTTSTTVQTSTTTTTPSETTTTTVPVPDDNEPPTLEIISPVALAAYIAAYDVDRKDFGTNVALSAVVSDPNGDAVTVTWSSSTQGGLGTGESIVAFLSTGGYDASQPVITATATDVWGTATSQSVQIIVWIPSDT